MSGPVSDDFACAVCGGAVRCAGAGFRHDPDGNVLGVVEGYECEDDDHSGEVVYEGGEMEIYRLTGVVRR